VEKDELKFRKPEKSLNKAAMRFSADKLKVESRQKKYG